MVKEGSAGDPSLVARDAAAVRSPERKVRVWGTQPAGRVNTDR